MNPMKLKILAIESSVRGVSVRDTRPDKRFKSGVRKLNTFSPRIAVDTTLICSGHPQARIFSVCMVAGYGDMKIVDIQKNGEIRLRNVDMTFQENYKLSFKQDEYIDVLPLFIPFSESTRQIQPIDKTIKQHEQ